MGSLRGEVPRRGVPSRDRNLAVSYQIFRVAELGLC
jgi:hypothetical protein